MRTRIVVPVLLCVLALLGGCAGSAPAKPESRIDPSANIPASKTFGWPPPANNLVSTDVTQRRFDEIHPRFDQHQPGSQGLRSRRKRSPTSTSPMK